MVKSAQRSDAVIFESKFTMNLFIDKYKVNAKKSYVINFGKSKFFYRINPKEAKTLSSKYDSYKAFVLCVSHLYPYKNIVRMLKAFKAALDATSVNLKLVIAGSRNFQYYDEEILRNIQHLGLQESISLIGSVSREELRYLYSQCEFLIFPSPYENFAYTLVEAMSCGAAITCSNTTSMPETCEDAAVYFDPNSVEEMSEKIKLLIDNKGLRKTLGFKSIDRVKKLPDYKEATIKTFDIMFNLIS
jgi:glycosyltransferase involved in cell wall biosynthesis